MLQARINQERLFIQVWGKIHLEVQNRFIALFLTTILRVRFKRHIIEDWKVLFKVSYLFFWLFN